MPTNPAHPSMDWANIPVNIQALNELNVKVKKSNTTAFCGRKEHIPFIIPVAYGVLQCFMCRVAKEVPASLTPEFSAPIYKQPQYGEQPGEPEPLALEEEDDEFDSEPPDYNGENYS